MAENKDTKPKGKFAENMAKAKLRIEAAAAAKAGETALAEVDKSVMEITQTQTAVINQSLDMWAESARGVPNVLLRNALFGIAKDRMMHKNRVLIASTKDVEIKFKGESFNQTDLDVFEMLLHLARMQPLGQSFEFSASEFLNALDRGLGKTQYEQLKDEMARLIGGVVEINFLESKKSFMGSLVRTLKRDDETKRFVVCFEDDMLKLFGEGFTLIDWEQRKALGQNNLAKWLQSHYSTHAKPYPEKVASLQKLCGSTDKELSSFRRQLKKALDELVSVGSLKSWKILPFPVDLVTVEAISSRSQLKHLSKTKKAGIKA